MIATKHKPEQIIVDLQAEPDGPSEGVIIALVIVFAVAFMAIVFGTGVAVGIALGDEILEAFSFIGGAS